MKIAKVFTLSAIVLLFTFSAGLGSAPAVFEPAISMADLAVPEIHTRAEIVARLDAYAKMTPGKPYTRSYKVGGLFDAGECAPRFLEHGRAAVNLFRYLAGLSADVRFDPAWNREAQHAALLLKVIGRLDHTPAYPEGSGLPRDMYDLGYSGTSTSDLFMGQADLGTATAGFIHDSDNSNIDRLGHRRWVFNPYATVMGYGYVDGFVALKVFSLEGGAAADTSAHMAYAAWPGVGDFPLTHFRTDCAWSFSLNEQAFPNGIHATRDSVQVILTRQKDGRIWKFGAGGSNGYFNVDLQGFGIQPCIIFRPDNLLMIADGDQYSVEINGVTDNDGSPVAVAYKVRFFNPGPAIVSKVPSSKPKQITLDSNWKTARFGAKSTHSANGRINIGYQDAPLASFSMVVDTPEGIVPLGVRVNSDQLITMPGETVSPGSRKITAVTFICAASFGAVKYTVFAASKGWAPWCEAGQAAGFPDGTPIEIIQLNME